MCGTPDVCVAASLCQPVGDQCRLPVIDLTTYAYTHRDMYFLSLMAATEPAASNSHAFDIGVSNLIEVTQTRSAYGHVRLPFGWVSQVNRFASQLRHVG